MFVEAFESAENNTSVYDSGRIYWAFPKNPDGSFKYVGKNAQVILENAEKILLSEDFDSIKILAIAIKNAAKSIQKEQ